MQWTKLLLLLLLVAVISAKKAHRKKHEKKHLPKDTTPNPGKDIFDMLVDDEADEDKRKKIALENDLEQEILNSRRDGYIEDPCADHKCGPGKECEVNEEDKPQCICVKNCPPEHDERRKVCSNHNETWNSDCELYQMRCLCTEDLDGCRLNKYKHVHIDYYGACKDISQCTDDEMEDFPRRMRDWLFNVMQDLARRDELDGVVLKMEQEAEKSSSRKWVNAVIWKFCDLDVHPHDRAVSRHELFPIRAPLMAMEHCISPFLDGCDANDDHKISLLEWGECLGLEEDEIEDKCVFIHRNRKG